MNKEYSNIEFYAGDTIDSAVSELLKCKSQGLLVSGVFNGVTLYSDTVTLDSAYKEITGKSKAEFKKAQQDWMDSYSREKREHKERIPELTKYWSEKGRTILLEEKWGLWDKIVPVRLNDLYRGMELGCCLDIVKILNNNGTLDEAKEKIESQNHSGMSFGLVCAMVREFCERGNEFVDYLK